MDATLTAWSECVPEPNMKNIIIHLPNFRSLMKNVVELLTLRIAHVPMHVIPSK